MDIVAIQRKLDSFAQQRNWEEYHSPKNLAMALAIEASELMEHFQWVGAEESRGIVNHPDQLQLAAEEVADVLICALRLADVLGLDIEKTVWEKIEKNAAKYPADKTHKWSF